MNDSSLIQLELGMNNRGARMRDARQDRHRRARWWFQKMRQVVNLAVTPRLPVHRRAEQTYLGLIQPALVTTRPGGDSRH